MSHNYYLLLELIVISFFFYLMLFKTGDKNKYYIQYVLIIYPFMSIGILPSLGYPNIFDITTISFIILFYRSNPIYIPFIKSYVFLIFILIISILIGIYNASINSVNTIESLMQYFSIFAFSKILIDVCFFEKEFFDKIITYLRTTIIVSLIFLTLQFIFGTTFTFNKSININTLQGNHLRFPSFFQDPQKFAQFLAVGFFLSLIPNYDKNKWIRYVLPPLIFIALLFTGGRAAFLGLIIGVFIVVLFGWTKIRWTILFSVIAILLIGTTLTDRVSILNRTSTFDESYQFRKEIWNDAIEIFKLNPFFGIGIGNYAKYVEVHNPDQYWISENNVTIYDHPENGYLKILTEFGIVGSLAIFACITLPIFKGIAYFFKSNDITTLLLIAALLSWMVGFVTVYSLGDVRIGILIATIISMLIVRPHNDNIFEYE